MSHYVKKTNRSRTPRRIFTRADDELILSQPANIALSVSKLETIIKASRETIERRAEQLGVVLRIKKRENYPSNRYNRHQKSRPDEVLSERVFMHDSGNNPVHVGADKLLSRLIDEHGDRLKREKV